MTPKEALAFVKLHGVVLQAAHGPVPSLAEAIAGGRIRGSWWGHPKGREIFRTVAAITDNPDVLVCKLVEGKVTYVHRRLWPALVKVAGRFRKSQLARVRDEHTASGAHRSQREPFPEWVPSETIRKAKAMSALEAEAIFSAWLAFGGAPPAGGMTLPKHDVFAMTFARVYPMYVQKAERKNRTKKEVDQIIRWLTGYDQAGLQKQIKHETDFETFFAQAPAIHPNSSLIKGVVCGIRVEEIKDPLMQKIRYLDKLIDELANGKAMEKILRQ